MILLTGGTGFLGKSILNVLGHNNISTLSKTGADINCDLSSSVPALPAIYNTVIHAAGKAHMAASNEQEQQAFFDVNVRGTRNLLRALEIHGLPASFVFISSVSVYGRNSGVLIKENAGLEAEDPYGRSKIQAEELVSEWCGKHGVICTILRLPLIAGPRPPGNLSSMIRGIQRGYYFNIAGGGAKKSIVLAEDVAAVIPGAAETGGIFNLTDGCHPTFYELSLVISKQLVKKPARDLVLPFAKLIAVFGDILGNRFPLNSDKLVKITSDLTFDDSKAREILGWSPRPVLKYFNIK